MSNPHSSGGSGQKDIHDIHSSTQLNVLPMIWEHRNSRGPLENGENREENGEENEEGNGEDKRGGYSERIPSSGHYEGNVLDQGLDPQPSKDNRIGTYPQLVLRTMNPRPQYVPPLNFSLVEDGIYRSGFPMPVNYPFLTQLGIKTIIYLGDLGTEKKDKKSKKSKKEDSAESKKDSAGSKEEDADKDKKKKKDKHGTAEIMSNYQNWLATTDIRFHHLEVDSSQEPFLSQDQHERAQKSLTTALELMLNKQNFPILIHSNKGKHRTGVLVGLMRKILQGWCMSGIFEEYEKFAMGKSEFDLEFIELWQPELVYEEDSLPAFVRVA